MTFGNRDRCVIGRRIELACQRWIMKLTDVKLMKCSSELLPSVIIDTVSVLVKIFEREIFVF